MRIPRLRTLGWLAAPVLLWAVLGTALADPSDPPGRAARLSYLEGPVSLEPAGFQEWAAAELNRPLTTGDRLWTDQGAVAELDIGPAVIRLGSNTGFSFLNLDDNTAQMQLSAGTLIVRVWDTSNGENYEIDTPNLAITLQTPGVYRVEVAEAGDMTVVKVSDGQALAASGGQSIVITTQQVATFTGTTQLDYAAATLGPPDDLDNWSSTRDQQAEESPSRQYVADDVAGTDDLDDNGRWEETPDYGYVWTPAVVVAGWVPYRYGHWLWVSPWGWTWVDAERWGYAPFHYGRWVNWHGSWCWVPGPRGVRPVYAPALVAWTGGPGARGNVGWFPLGPHEVYAPAYRVSDAYLRKVNTSGTVFVDNTYIANVYQHRVINIRYVNGTPAAISAVPQNVFASAQRVSGHTVAVAAAAVAGLAVTGAAPAIAPQRQSVLGSAAGGRVARPPPVIANRGVVARTTPPRAAPPFETQLAAIRANGGRPLAGAELARLQPAAPAVLVRAAPAAGKFTPANLSSRVTAPSQPTLAERARALQNRSLPAAGSGTFSVYSSPAPSAPAEREESPVPVPQRSFAADDPSHAYGRPSAVTSYRPQTPLELRPAPVRSAPTPAPVSRPQYRSAPARPPTPRTESPHSQPSREDSGAHADRSRDRLQR